MHFRAKIPVPRRALAILRTFLETPHLGGKYAERRDALTALGGL